MIHTVFVLVFVLLGCELIGAPAWAQAAPTDNDDNRYSYTRVEEGYLRLDMRSGEVSLCNHRTTGWSCELAPDERRVTSNEIARLHAENAALKKALFDRGLPLPGSVQSEAAGVKPDAQAAGQGDQADRPSARTDAEPIKVLVGRMWRRLVDMFVNLQRDVLKRT
jgi:hypothetical protein